MKIITTTTKARLHIISGMVLFVFLTSHFINHALGLSSVELMETGRGFFNIVWRSWPGTVLLYGSVFVHFASALDALYRRRSLRMPISETVKIGFGIALPFLIASHVIGTRLEFALSGYERGYPEVLRAQWSTLGSRAMYTAAVIIAWSHGCLGLWFWLRGRPWFPRVAPIFHMAAVTIPVLALLGFFEGARAVSALPSLATSGRPADPELLRNIQTGIYFVFAALVATAILVKMVPRRNRIQIRYFEDKLVSITPGFSVLEASRSAGIPHVSICGGRGRCSTCRIQVLQGLSSQPLPEGRERTTLQRIGAPDDVRLACQLRPTHDLTVLPLVEADGFVIATQTASDKAAGRERMVVALFCDLRGFTELSERKLPYDVVFLLNRYFAMVDEAVEGCGGVVDKFIGDGAIALFGLEGSFDRACRQALVCAARLSAGLETLNRSFSNELDAPLRIAIGLHAGPAIVGRMGHGRAATLTAVGDTINIASRLEGLAKQHDAELVVSAELIKHAHVTLGDHESQELAIRGRAATLETLILPDARKIAAFVASSPALPEGEARRTS